LARPRCRPRAPTRTRRSGRLAELVNPFRSIDAATVLVCGVVRLPLANGVARIDRSIGIETQKVGVAASGTIDFRTRRSISRSSRG